jgi:hypothetical protein
MTGSLLGDQYYVFNHISLGFSQNEKCRENNDTHFMLNVFFIKWRPLSNNVEKYCRAGQVKCDNIAHAHCVLDTEGYKFTLRIGDTSGTNAPQCFVIRTLRVLLNLAMTEYQRM